MSDEAEITVTIKLQLNGVNAMLTLAEAKALRAQLNELLGKDDPIAQPITLPFTSPVDTPKNPPGKLTRTSGETRWVKADGTTVAEMPEAIKSMLDPLPAMGVPYTADDWAKEGQSWKSDDADCR